LKFPIILELGLLRICDAGPDQPLSLQQAVAALTSSTFVGQQELAVLAISSASPQASGVWAGALVFHEVVILDCRRSSPGILARPGLRRKAVVSGTSARSCAASSAAKAFRPIHELVLHSRPYDIDIRQAIKTERESSRSFLFSM